MSEQEKATVTEIMPTLEKLISDSERQILFNQFIKHRISGEKDEITYTDIPWSKDDKEYVIKALHIPIEEIAKKAQGNCKNCNSKGYIVKWVDKKSTPDPENYIVLADVPFRSLSEEQKKEWIEIQKKKKTWKIALPCICAMKGYLRSQASETTLDIIMYSPNFNIVVRLSYEEKSKGA